MKVVVAGDFAPRNRLAEQVNSRRFGEIFPETLVRLLRSVDYSLVNFESPVVEENCKPIAKCGSNLKCSPFAIDAVCYAGFQAVTLANNHVFDFGEDGLNATLRCCAGVGLDSVGVGKNLDEAGRTLYVRRKEKTLAVINCCEHEFTIATEDSPGANPLNPIQQYYSIRGARENADYVLVIVHGGHEHYQLPSPRMQETYRFFVDSGADVVINHHQHCCSGYEIYKGKPIFYGLGNFCFDTNGKPTREWTEGYMVELSLGGKVSFKIHPYRQYAVEPKLELLAESAFDEKLEALNAIICNECLLKKKSADITILLSVKGWGRVLNKLFRCGFLPQVIEEKSFPSSSIILRVNLTVTRWFIS